MTNIWITLEQLEYLTVFFHNQYLANNWTSSKDELVLYIDYIKCNNSTKLNIVSGRHIFLENV